MKKQAKDLKPGDKILVANQKYLIENIEISEIGKHGKRKCRIEARGDKDKIVLIRPEDYPIDTV